MKKVWEELTKSKALKSVMTGMLFVAFYCMVATGCGNTEALSQEQEKEMSSEQIDRAFEKTDNIAADEIDSFDGDINDFLQE